MTNTIKTIARIGANALPAYRVYAGLHTAERLRTDMHNPLDRTWGFAGRVAFDAATDKIDGILARYASTTRFGGYLDQIADKAWFLLIARQLAQNGEIPEAFVKIPAVRDIGTTILRPIAGHYGLNSDAQLSGKIKMLAQINATVAACSPIAAKHPEFVETLYGISAGASVLSGADMLVAYVDELAAQRESSKAAQFIVAGTTWLLDSNQAPF